MEAALVKIHVQNLVDAGVKPEDIAIGELYSIHGPIADPNLM
jgi:hypothetical protein